jgi:hypothetical protein
MNLSEIETIVATVTTIAKSVARLRALANDPAVHAEIAQLEKSYADLKAQLDALLAKKP